jgi:hypothetical protein
MMYRLRNAILVGCVAVIALRCVPVPTAPTDGAVFAAEADAVWVLCEGLWRSNDSQLWHVSAQRATGDVVALVNPGERLGDTASDIVRNGDTLLIAVSGSRSIDAVDARTGKRLARIPLDGTKEPYRLTLVNDSTLYCTNLNDDSMTEIDARSLRIRIAHIPAGPAPEGVDAAGQIVAVANSGLGDLRRSEADAGTVYIYRRSDMLRVHMFTDLPNVADVRIDEARRLLWVTYRHFPSQPDSLGGVVAYDLSTFAERVHRRLRGLRAMDLDARTGEVVVLHGDGIDAVTLTSQRRIITHRSEGDAVWYGMGLHPSDGTIWIGDAKSYLTPGDVVVLDRDGHEVRRLRVGRNPTAFVFPTD